MHRYHVTITPSSSSQSPWFPYIRTAIAQKNPLIAKSTHAQIIKHGITSSDKFLVNNMINMYGKCGCLIYARQLFDEMPQRDLVTWNSILAAYGSGCEVDGGNVEKGMSLFWVLLRLGGGSLTKMTFAPVLKMCLASSCVWSSECVHGLARKIGLDSEVFVSGGLVNVYIKFGKVKERKEIDVW